MLYGFEPCPWIALRFDPEYSQCTPTPYIGDILPPVLCPISSASSSSIMCACACGLTILVCFASGLEMEDSFEGDL